MTVSWVRQLSPAWQRAQELKNLGAAGDEVTGSLDSAQGTNEVRYTERSALRCR